jgi:hypothetical protein
MLRCGKIAFATFLSALIFGQNVWAETITVGSVSGLPGETVQMQVKVDVADNIQGAAFTVSYNQDYLTLRSVTSPFFRTFADQFAEMASPPTPLPPTQVKVDGITYDKPMIVNLQQPGSVMMAAAKVQAGAGESRLFILEFDLAADIPDGGYPVSIGTSIIKSTAAGYPAGGIALPLLFPISSTGVVNGMVSVNITLQDSDHDGIDDNWEKKHFTNLSTAKKTTDFDKDGYTDLQEYLNWLGNLRDSNGAEFDPKAENAPGSAGYRVVNPHFWLLMMPVLMEMNKQ